MVVGETQHFRKSVYETSQEEWTLKGSTSPEIVAHPLEIAGKYCCQKKEVWEKRLVVDVNMFPFQQQHVEKFTAFSTQVEVAVLPPQVFLRDVYIRIIQEQKGSKIGKIWADCHLCHHGYDPLRDPLKGALTEALGPTTHGSCLGGN